MNAPISKVLVCLLALTCTWSATRCVNAGGKSSDTIASGSPTAPGTYDVGGNVYAINIEFGYIVVQTNKGCFQAIYPDAYSSIVKNGLPATMLDISIGDRVRSSNSLTTGKAISIDVRS